MTYHETDQGGVIFGSGEAPFDPSERTPWIVITVSGRWWLQRDVVALERQIAAGEGLVHQVCKRRVERLGPFATLNEASGYLDAMEGR